MFLFRKPSPSFVRAFLQEQAKLAFTYSAVGATAGTPPVGYVVDHTRIKLGSGPAAFAAAKEALQRWEQFRLGWVEPCWPDTPIEVGQVVNESRKFGFAYGTLPGHVESGEERFTVEWHEDDAVWYDILAFSRPNHFLARLGYPLVGRLQKRFARDSGAAVRRAAGITRQE